MPAYMLDTDISSYLMNGSNAGVDRRIESVGWMSLVFPLSPEVNF
jgi:hypothetical protein